MRGSVFCVCENKLMLPVIFAKILNRTPGTRARDALLPIVEIEMDRCTDCLTELDAVQSEADRQANVQ